MKTITEKKTIKKTINKYIANDGQEFTNKEACLKHEEELKLKEYLKRYEVNENLMVIQGITADTHMCYSLKYTGKKEDFIDCLNLLQKYYIEDGEISFDNDLSNVRSSDTSLDSLKDTEFKEGEIYIFAITWDEHCNSYDVYYWTLWDAESAFYQVKKTIQKIEEVFQTKYKGDEE